MSEAEKQRRSAYRKNRSLALTVQVVVIILVFLITIASFGIYCALNKTLYIEYTEQGNIDYRVHLHENDFYDEAWQQQQEAYVASLIDTVEADLTYELAMGADNVDFDYSYGVLTQLIIADKESGLPIYAPIDETVPEKTFTQPSGHKLSIRESTDIDYAHYNDIAAAFVETYELTHADCYLQLTLQVNVISRCDRFESNGNNNYSVSLIIPLLRDTNTVNMQTITSVPTGESRVLACGSSANQHLFRSLAVAGSVLLALQIIAITVYAYLTRNDDIRYEARVKRVLSNYRSFIQVIKGDFDDTGYQILTLSTFHEMLSIRDTIQSPVLMSENEDKTRTRFLIPTHTKLLYVFEIKVDNYDELYAKSDVDELENDLEENREEVETIGAAE